MVNSYIIATNDGDLDVVSIHYPLIYDTKDHMNNWTQRRLNVNGITKELPPNADDIDALDDYSYYFPNIETRKITYYYDD